jgi:hypothetical protein
MQSKSLDYPIIFFYISIHLAFNQFFANHYTTLSPKKDVVFISIDNLYLFSIIILIIISESEKREENR